MQLPRLQRDCIKSTTFPSHPPPRSYAEMPDAPNQGRGTTHCNLLMLKLPRTTGRIKRAQGY